MLGVNSDSFDAHTKLQKYLLSGLFLFFLPNSSYSAPKNITELFQSGNLLITFILLSGFIFIFLGTARILGNIILDKKMAAYATPLWLLLLLSLSWILLRDAVPAESLHDILGSPVKNWPWEWEYIYRFTALFAWLIMSFTISIIFAESFFAREMPSRTSFFTYASLFIFSFVFFHYVTVIDAATDNLTELMEGHGSIISSIYLTLSCIFAGLGAAAINARRSRDKSIPSVILLIGISYLFSGLFVWLGTEDNVEKYGQSFHALQFLILGDRSLELSIFHISLIYTAIYILFNIVMLGCFSLMNLIYTKALPKFDNLHNIIRLPSNSDFWLFLLYTLFIFYGTLFSTTEWIKNADSAFNNILTIWQKDISPFDILVNITVYLPLGYFLSKFLLNYYQRGITLLYCILISLLCSISLEILQLVIPNRVSSILDIFLNTLSGFIGAWFAIKFKWNLKTQGLWQTYLFTRSKSKTHQLGLVTIICWLMYEASPLIPGLYLSNIVDGIKPVWLFIQGQQIFSYLIFMHYFATALFVLYLIKTLFRDKSNIIIALVLCCLIFSKVLIIGQQLSIESLIAYLSSLLIYYMTKDVIKSHHTIFLISLLTCGYILGELIPAAIPTDKSFNLIPFYFQLSDPKSMLYALSQSWIVLAIAYLLLLRSSTNTINKVTVILGAGLIFVLVLAVNLVKQNIDGRHGDITDSVLLTIIWFILWRFILQTSQASEVKNGNKVFKNNRLVPIILASFVLLPIFSVNWVSNLEVGSQLSKTQSTNTFPEPNTLPRPPLPSFKITHPRLPSPSVDELALLQEKNQAYIRTQKFAANKKRPNLQSIVFLELLEPGSQDLQVLFKQLMALEFQGRGSDQVKPLAVAFDWLYFSWTDEQRKLLAGKLAQGCIYEINFIRKEKLSPYNVILYNSPLQGLMACAIALYHEHPDAGDIMAFTYDMWKKRVLPVWRQVMGKNGGWHEGGEYVGIGIGQAIYQLPAMWRSATGEDFFKSEPGIKGFLDFLIYRTRPDGTHMRWGDAAYFNKKIPDQLALALEFSHLAAYQLAGPPNAPTPSSWPWGPLTIDLSQANKILTPTQLPTIKYFDGIGMIIARNDWTPNATYFTFKAGDNFWSHSHLDQGAFTIYKGGPLAIDSGFYGPKYGSEHHMNYTYQTIAHNTITVSDPEDNIPLPPKKEQEKPRAIANDGGQRRVGSGWGFPAPIDLEEWNEHSEIYHTASLKKLQIKNDLFLVTTDLTPAYTNRNSGKNQFNDRKNRVEYAFRSIGYDLEDDVIVIFDNIKSTNASFRKKWLLHTIDKPIINGNSFVTLVKPSPQKKQQGGRLDGKVLYPINPYIQNIGGKGFEFFVDNKNYDENGTLQNTINRRGKLSEPGSWRMEIIPNDSALNNKFLVVLLPSDKFNKAPHEITLTIDGQRIGCLVKGPKRTTQWWFDPVSNTATGIVSSK